MNRNPTRVPAPILLLAHGAGAGQASPWMEAWAERLAALGEVERFEYPYMAARKKRPDPLPALIEAHREALALARARHGADRPVVLVGKSMGSRVGCHLALSERVHALVCLGYPLLGARKKDGSRTVRDEVLMQLASPVLFVQGTRDALCPLDALRPVLDRMAAPRALHVVEGGDHSLLVGKRSLPPQAEVDAAILRAVSDFVDVHSGASYR